MIRTLLCWLLLCSSASAVDLVVTLDHVHDGDTFSVDIPAWAATGASAAVVADNMPVRVAGIDCPESHDPNPIVHAYAAKVTAYVTQRLKRASTVVLRDPARDKYFRLNAVVLVDGDDLGAELIAMKYAKPYDGGTKSPWTPADCGQPAPPQQPRPRFFRFLR